MLGLRFCAMAFSSCGKWGPLFIAARGPLTIAASLVAEHRLQTRRLSSCGSRAQLLRGMWDLPRPGLEPVFPALAGRFSTTAPPGKPSTSDFLMMSLIAEQQSRGLCLNLQSWDLQAKLFSRPDFWSPVFNWPSLSSFQMSHHENHYAFGLLIFYSFLLNFCF